MAIHGFHHHGRTVSDMETALRFYRDLLGLQVVDDADLEGAEMSEFLGLEDVRIRAVMLSADGQAPYMELFQFRSPRVTAAGGGPAPNLKGTAHPCFLVDDIHAEFDRLSKAGVGFTRPPLQIDGGPFEGQWILYGFDPDGAIVEFWSVPEGT
jgi:glyoxylase I family protein